MSDTLQTFWQQLTRSRGNKFVFWAFAAGAVVFALLGILHIWDGPSGRLSSAGCQLIWGVNILVTWRQNEQRVRRGDLTRRDHWLILGGAASVLSAIIFWFL